MPPHPALRKSTLLLSSSHRKSNKVQQRIKILFRIYMKLNMLNKLQQPSTYAKPEAASAVLGSL
jgi:hypothetical protein